MPKVNVKNDAQCPGSPKISSFPSLPDMSPKKVSATRNVYVSPLRSSKLKLVIEEDKPLRHPLSSNTIEERDVSLLLNRALSLVLYVLIAAQPLFRDKIYLMTRLRTFSVAADLETNFATLLRAKSLGVPQQIKREQTMLLKIKVVLHVD